MERTKPEYPGVRDLNFEIRADPQRAEYFRLLRASRGPLQFGPGTDFPVLKDLSERFDVKSSMSMALHPKQDQPWLFGLHQCACAHIWTMEEERLFQEIGRRMEDALTSLLIHRNLRESKERYRIVFENSPVSIWEEDFSAVKNLFDDLKKRGVADIEAWLDRHPETVRHCAEAVKIVDVNQAAVALHGAANKEALFAGLTQIFTPESLDAFRRELVCLWDEGTDLRTDSVVKTLAGERRDVTVYFSVCPGHEETLSKVVVSLIDITERKRIEKALSASEAELRSLIQAMTDIIIVCNAEGRYLKIADTSPSHSYKPSNELLGKTLHDVFPKDRADFFLDNIRQALNAQTPVHFEYSLPIGDKQFWFDATISPMSDDQILLISRNITERKQAEEKLVLYRDHLEAMVQERTVELEASNKELQNFTYSVSHDLRAPLRHIDGFMELLQEKTATDFDEKGRRYMDAISDAARKMGRLIDELLSFTWMGRHVLSLQRVALKELVRDILREFEPATAGRSIKWRIGDLPVVGGDAAMLKVVMANLIANALKFTQPRQAAQIEIGSQPGQNAEAVIYVRDNGVGFDMAYADKLFGVFQRLHRAEAFEGLGIGLANVRRIIARHGGRVWAESKPDQGATFYFSLPQS
jgi:PAS domain S-box-containing protein